MRHLSAEQLNSSLDRPGNCGGGANGYTEVRNQRDFNSSLYIRGACPQFFEALKCYQSLGWPISTNPRAVRKKEVTGEDILLSELKTSRKEGPNDAALNRIDDKEDELKCYEKPPEDPSCHDLETRRSNLIFGKPEMLGVIGAASEQAASNSSTSSPAKKISPDTSRSGTQASIDVDSGLSASQCITAEALKVSFTLSGLKSECFKVIDGVCNYMNVTERFTNRCKRPVSGDVDWGGKKGYVTVPGLGSGKSDCQTSSGSDPDIQKPTVAPEVSLIRISNAGILYHRAN